MATAMQAGGATLTSPSTTMQAGAATLTSAATTAMQVGGATLSAAGGSTAMQAGGAYLASAQAEPYRTINLPSGTWTQTAGPTVAPPTVLAPAVIGGTTLTYTSSGATFTFTVLPHTVFGRKASDGSLYPIRRRPA